MARELGVHEGTLGRWVNADRRARQGEGTLSESERDELNRLRVPVGFQAVGDQPVVRVDGQVTAPRQVGVVAGAFNGLAA